MASTTLPDGALALDVIARHPDGMLVEDRDGRLLAGNAAARRMLGRAWTELRLGCVAAGCDRPGTTCPHVRADAPGAEQRVELPGGGAAWVSVTQLGGERDLVLTQLRPAAQAAQRPEPHLEIFALGQTSVTGPGGSLDGRWLRNRPGQVLKFLVAERHRAVDADELLERLWPNGHRADARGLRYYLHALRSRLEPDGAPTPPSSFVLARRGAYELHRTRVWIDATAFEELVSAGLAADARGEGALALDRLRRGLELYRGDFLADERYADWAVRERDRLREIAAGGLRALSARLARSGDLDAAAGALGRLTDLDPYDVDVHRELLALHLRRRRHSEALRCYEALRRRMLSAFGEELDFTLADVASVAQRAQARR